MRKRALSITLFMLSAVILLTAVPAMAAAKKKAPAKKAPAKRVVLGTTQLKGDQAKLGVTYTLGKRDPLNVTLDRVEYTVEPMMIGDTVQTVKANEKLLVLHYTLHNPNPRNRGLAWSTFNIHAIDANDTNWRYITNVGIESTRQSCNMSLKPAQKTKVFTAVVVPAKGELPKLMFEGSDKLVLRYDLRGKVKALPAPIADPADPSGGTALENVPAEMGVFYPMMYFKGKIDSIEFSDVQFKGRAAKKGTRHLVIVGTVKNELTVPRGVAWNTFRPRLVDADGGEIPWNSNTLYPSRDDNINGKVEPGQELRFRWVFEVPEKLGLKSISMTELVSRSYVYDLTGVK